MLKNIKKYPFTITWTIIVLILSFKPNPEIPNFTFFQLDKVVHFIFYFFYGIFLTFEIRRELLKRQYLKISNRLTITTAFGMPFLIGFVVELVQGKFISGRQFDVFDIVANGLGAAAATIVVLCKIYSLTRKS